MLNPVASIDSTTLGHYNKVDALVVSHIAVNISFVVVDDHHLT